MSSKFINVNAASRLERETTGLRGGRGTEDFCFGETPKSKVGRKDSGAGAEMGCGRAVVLNEYTSGEQAE
jgi:hypothetical protein